MRKGKSKNAQADQDEGGDLRACVCVCVTTQRARCALCALSALRGERVLVLGTHGAYYGVL